MTRISVGKLKVPKLVQQFPALYGIITLLTNRQWVLSWASYIHSTHSYSTSRRSTLILSCHLRLRYPSGLFPSGFSSLQCVPHAQHTHLPRYGNTNYICWGVQIMWRSSLCSFLQSPVTSSESHPFYSKPCSRIPSAYVTPLMLTDRVSNPCAVTGKIMIYYI